MLRWLRRHMINTRLVNHLTNLDITPRLDFMKFGLEFSGERESESGLLKVQTFFTCLKTTGSGDPTTSCRPECSQLSDCPFNRQCQESRCVDPCLINIETGHLGSNLHYINIQKISKTMCLRWIRFCPRSLMFTKAFPYCPCWYSVFYTNCFISKITYISFLRINIIYYQPK